MLLYITVIFYGNKLEPEFYNLKGNSNWNFTISKESKFALPNYLELGFHKILF